MSDATEQRDDPVSAVPGREMTRRDFVHAAAGVGFAAAVLPVTAQTLVHTPDDGLLAGRVKIEAAGLSVPAYRAAPAGRSGLPVVLVVSEVFGVHEHIADVARRFARLGYLAIAPELFVRQGDAAGYTDIARLISEVVSQVPDAQVMADLDAVVAWAATQGGDLQRLGVTGFCWGGRITWLYAAHQPKVRAGVAWYGRLVGGPTALTPRHPVDLVADLKAPVLGLYGGQDSGIPLTTVEQMKLALAAGSPAARRSELAVYPQAEHAFHADYRPSYQAEAAHDGWRRTLDWFARHGAV